MLLVVPTELTVAILVHVPAPDLVTCAKTCTHLRNLVNGSNPIWRRKCAELWRGKEFHDLSLGLHWTTPTDLGDLTVSEVAAIATTRQVHGCDEDIAPFVQNADSSASAPVVAGSVFDDDDSEEDGSWVDEEEEGEEDSENSSDPDAVEEDGGNEEEEVGEEVQGGGNLTALANLDQEALLQMAELLANYGGYSTSSIVRQQDPPMERPILERELQSLIAKRHQLLYCKWKWSYICSLLDSTRISIYPNELINIEWHLNASWTEEPGRSCFHRVVGKAGTQNLVAHSTLWDGHHLQVRYVDARGERIRLGDYPSRMIYRDPQTWGWHMRNRWVLNTSLGKPGVPLQLREAICAIAFGL